MNTIQKKILNTTEPKHFALENNIAPDNFKNQFLDTGMIKACKSNLNKSMAMLLLPNEKQLAALDKKANPIHLKYLSLCNLYHK